MLLLRWPYALSNRILCAPCGSQTGGGVYATSYSQLTIERTVIARCMVFGTEGHGGGIGGGGIGVYVGSYLILRDAQIRDCLVQTDVSGPSVRVLPHTRAAR